jgi:hypothetical protein
MRSMSLEDNTAVTRGTDRVFWFPTQVLCQKALRLEKAASAFGVDRNRGRQLSGPRDATERAPGPEFVYYDDDAADDYEDPWDPSA